MVVAHTEPCAGRIDGLSDSHDPSERPMGCKRVPNGEGDPFVQQFYSIHAPGVLCRHMQPCFGSPGFGIAFGKAFQRYIGEVSERGQF
jgi:hypothetical protein